MGEKQNQPFQLSFNSSLKVDFQGARVTSDGGLILVRELDERLGFGDLIAQHLTDSRRGKNTQLPWLTCCANPSTVGSRAMRMSTMPSGSRRIPRSG
ncbi:MAG: transposase [Blastocatellia bacterium]